MTDLMTKIKAAQQDGWKYVGITDNKVNGIPPDGAEFVEYVAEGREYELHPLDKFKLKILSIICPKILNQEIQVVDDWIEVLNVQYWHYTQHGDIEVANFSDRWDINIDTIEEKLSIVAYPVQFNPGGTYSTDSSYWVKIL